MSLNKPSAKSPDPSPLSDTHPIDGDQQGGGEHLARLCGNVLSSPSQPPERPAWVLPYVVTLRSAALAYQSARRKGEQPDPRQLAASLLSATQEKMNRWPVASVLPTWLDARLSRDLLTRLGVDPSLHEKHLIEWLSEPAREMGCNFPCADSGVDLPA